MKKKNCGKWNFLENSLHNRRFMSQARRRLLLALRAAECEMLRSPHLAAFIQRLLCRLLEKKKKKRECRIRYPPFHTMF